MKHSFYLFIFIVALIACNRNATHTTVHVDTTYAQNVPELAIPEEVEEPMERLSFTSTTEVVSDCCHAIWVEKKDNTFSLALHFQYKDTVAVSYSPECWIMFPYKLEENKIVVYWDNNIDTKYDFDLVKAMNKTNKKYIGKPFMMLELINDSTCKATYLLEELVRDINSSSKKRTFFPDTFVVVQNGEMYD